MNNTSHNDGKTATAMVWGCHFSHHFPVEHSFDIVGVALEPNLLVELGSCMHLQGEHAMTILRVVPGVCAEHVGHKAAETKI